MQKIIDFVFLGLTAYGGWQLQQQQEKMIENNKQVHEFLQEERTAYQQLRNDYFVLLQNYLNAVPHLESAAKLKAYQDAALQAEEIAGEARAELYACSEKYTSLHNAAMEQMEQQYEQMQKHLEALAAELARVENQDDLHQEECAFLKGYDCNCFCVNRDS